VHKSFAQDDKVHLDDNAHPNNQELMEESRWLTLVAALWGGFVVG